MSVAQRTPWRRAAAAASRLSPQRFREDEDVSRPAPRVREDAARIDEAGHGVPELDLGIADGVAAEQDAVRLLQHLRPPADDGGRPFEREVRLRKRRYRERGERPPSHRVDVGQGVRGRDPSERRGVVHDRGEEVDGLHEGGLLVEPEHTGVVPRAVVDQHPGVGLDRNAAQDLSELGGAELARSAGAGDPLGEPADPLSLVAHSSVRTPPEGQLPTI
jgi:hypothetical protein